MPFHFFSLFSFGSHETYTLSDLPVRLGLCHLIWLKRVHRCLHKTQPLLRITLQQHTKPSLKTTTEKPEKGSDFEKEREKKYPKTQNS